MPIGAEAAPANPFEGASFYVSPEWIAEIESAAVAAPEKAALVRSLASQPVALWINSIDAAKNKVPSWLDGARGKLAVLVLYDLPNRDCAAAASAGELGPRTKRAIARRSSIRSRRSCARTPISGWRS